MHERMITETAFSVLCPANMGLLGDGVKNLQHALLWLSLIALPFQKPQKSL